MSAGAQENFPTGGAGVATPRVGNPLVRRIFGHHGDLEGPSRFTWVKNALFLAVVTFVSILALYPFIWLISASLKLKRP